MFFISSLARITIRPSPTEPWVRRAIPSTAVVQCSFEARILKITSTASDTSHRAMVSTITNDAAVREFAGEPEAASRLLLEELTNTHTSVAVRLQLFILGNLLRIKVAVFWCNRVRIPQTIKI